MSDYTPITGEMLYEQILKVRLAKPSYGIPVKLEHRDGIMINAHDPDTCAGEHCTLHNRSNHSMRSFPQIWRIDWGGFMERVCPHGIGHPDPDEINFSYTHGCDGCCKDAYVERSDYERTT